MDFKERFLLLRGKNVNNQKIKSLTPDLLQTTKILTIEKLSWSYFILDFFKRVPIAKFNYLVKSNPYNSNINYTVFEKYLNASNIIDNFVSSEKLNIYLDRTYLKVSKVFSHDNDWFLVILNDNSFIFNSKSFIDYIEYFNRVNKINRLINNIK